MTTSDRTQAIAPLRATGEASAGFLRAAIPGPPAKHFRKATFRLYPNQEQAEQLDAIRIRQQRLYNCALEHRIRAYQKGAKIGLFDQIAAIKEIRAEWPEYRAESFEIATATLRRLDRAYKAFFRRVKAGQVAGFPRFQPCDRFRSFGIDKESGKGWKFVPNGSSTRGLFSIKGVTGQIKARGGWKRPGVTRTCEVIKNANGWHLTVSLLLDDAPTRERGTEALAFDWGVKTYVSGALASGKTFRIENERIFEQSRMKIRALKKSLSRKRKGSNNYKKSKAELARAMQKDANRRKHRAHIVSHELISRADLIATEQLQLQNMTRSAKGSAESPGKNVRQKAGLNREILDTAPGLLLANLKYKCDEAGIEFAEIDTRSIKPSQTCPACGHQAKKKLRQRTHKCDCGYTEDRDIAAAQVILRTALKETGRNTPRCGENNSFR